MYFKDVENCLEDSTIIPSLNLCVRFLELLPDDIPEEFMGGDRQDYVGWGYALTGFFKEFEDGPTIIGEKTEIPNDEFGARMKYEGVEDMSLWEWGRYYELKFIGDSPFAPLFDSIIILKELKDLTKHPLPIHK